MSGNGTGVLVISDTHLPVRARDLPAPVWDEVGRADLVIHAGDTSEHTIYVQYAPGTVVDPDEIVETISHSSQSDDPAYNHASIANVYVNLPPPTPLRRR